jgi:geranylgeranyl diphosphate synthase type I
MNSSAEMIEEILIQACEAEAEVSSLCLQAIRSHFAAGGGRVRARICFCAGMALGLSEADAARTAGVCELLHNASLVQDDLLDRSAVRRGEPCIWVTHGDTIAICAGDLMLSSAYDLLAEISKPQLLAAALRLVHRRTREVILGHALEAVPKTDQEPTEEYYDRLAQGKSASLLSLSLELPMLLTKNETHLATANSVARDFAVAYQIADDLTDFMQDMHEGTANLALLLIQHDGMDRTEALSAAAKIAAARLARAETSAASLPYGCADMLLQYADRLRCSLEVPAIQLPAKAESPI